MRPNVRHWTRVLLKGMEMVLKDLIGREITNIYVLEEPEAGGLDMTECFVELDNEIIIDIPYEGSDEVWVKKLDKKAISVFKDISDYPVHDVNKEGRSVEEIAGNFRQSQRILHGRLTRLLFGPPLLPKEYRPYKVEYREKKMKYVKNGKIVDIIMYNEQGNKVCIQLDNGYIITETTLSPHGTGFAGINYFESFDDLVQRKGADYSRLSEVEEHDR